MSAPVSAPVPHPTAIPSEVIVPAAVVDTLVGLILRLDVGKGVMLGFRASVGVPLDVPMRLVVQDARLVPDPGVQS